LLPTGLDQPQQVVRLEGRDHAAVRFGMLRVQRNELLEQYR
jgi:hypothetical protein